MYHIGLDVKMEVTNMPPSIDLPPSVALKADIQSSTENNLCKGQHVQCTLLSHRVVDEQQVS